jgi:homopolymeric O-antigen transport system permease protein
MSAVGEKTLPRQRVVAPNDLPVTVITPRRRGLRPAAREVWESRRYIPYFGLLFIRKRFARTWLGLLWLPLRPSISLLTRLLVFGGLVGISAGKTPYPVFFLTASAAWQLFNECASWSTRSLEIHRRTLRFVQVPRLTVVLSAIVPSILDFLIYASFAALAVLYYVVRGGGFWLELSPRSIVYVPAGLLLILLIGLGIGLLTSSFGARAKDVRFAMGYALSFVYFLTPVIYPLSSVPNKYRPLAELNPLTGAMEMVKDGLFGGHTLSSASLAVTLTAVAGLWIPGVWLYQRLEVAGLRE